MKKILALMLVLNLTFSGCSVVGINMMGDTEKGELNLEKVEETVEKVEDKLDDDDDADQENGPITIIDQAGREVTLEKAAEKVVSCYYTSTSSFIALDQEDKLVGIEKGASGRELFKLSAPELIELPEVGSGKGINLETILSLNPDVCVMPLRLQDSIAGLEDAGIPVILVNPETKDQLFEMFEIIAQITDADDELEELLEFYDENLEILDGLNLEPTKTVYLSSNSSYLSSATTNMYQSYLIETAGGIFAASDLTDGYWVTISPEQMQNYNPDVWLTVTGASYSNDEIANDERFSNIEAVKNNQIVTIPSNLEGWDYPTPSSILGILFTANALHQDKYTDAMLSEAVTEFYDEFYDIDYAN